MLERLIEAGVNVVRLNFSHGEHADHLAVMRCGPRDRARARAESVALLQDLSGPEDPHRAGEGRRRSSSATAPRSRSPPTRRSRARPSASPPPTTRSPQRRHARRPRSCSTTATSSSRCVGPSERECAVPRSCTAALLKSNKGMNLPGVRSPRPALTEKDRRDLAFGVQRTASTTSPLSFVRQAAGRARGEGPDQVPGRHACP